MKVSPVNNNYNQSFNARLSGKEIKSLVDVALKDKTGANIPKLYTLLELLSKNSGKTASFKSVTETSPYFACGKQGSFHPSTTYYSLHIDGVKIKEGTNSETSTLYHAMTDFQTKEGQNIPMPQSVFDAMWWKNRAKNVKDIFNFALEKLG